MEHEENQGAEPMDAAAFAMTASSPGGAPAADFAEWEAAQSRISVLESRVACAEEENRAFLQSLRHAAAAAEELLDEARGEAALIRDAATRHAAELASELDARRASLTMDAQRDADRMLDEARTTAYELVVVARADAREAVHEERVRAANELEMLAMVRERVSEERNTLTQCHTQLGGRLRELAHSMLEFAERRPEVERSDQAFAATVLTGPQVGGAMESLATAVSRPAGADRAETHADEEHLERAFNEFFSADIEHEPSRRWILED